METFITFFTENLDYSLFFVIILSGIFITKYTKDVKTIANVYKVLIASIIISTLFYFIEGCNKEYLKKYVFTYLFTTSFYELIAKTLIFNIRKALKKK